MTGKELAKQVLDKYGTTDVSAITKQLDIKVIYQKWHPSTVGEFDRKTKTIYINLNADIEKERAGGTCQPCALPSSQMPVASRRNRPARPAAAERVPGVANSHAGRRPESAL